MLRFSQEELAAHASSASCFLAVDGSVYDVTSFLGSHPGGSGIVLANAGKVSRERMGCRAHGTHCVRSHGVRPLHSQRTQDVSELFHSFHKEGTIATVASLKVGELDRSNPSTAAVHGSESVQERWKGSGKGNFVVARLVTTRSHHGALAHRVSGTSVRIRSCSPRELTELLSIDALEAAATARHSFIVPGR
jgi:hypothetical protein